jgi:hypothetical protein
LFRFRRRDCGQKQGNTCHERNTGAKLDRHATRRRVDNHLHKGKYIGVRLYTFSNPQPPMSKPGERLRLKISLLLGTQGLRMSLGNIPCYMWTSQYATKCLLYVPLLMSGGCCTECGRLYNDGTTEQL